MKHVKIEEIIVPAHTVPERTDHHEIITYTCDRCDIILDSHNGRILQNDPRWGICTLCKRDLCNKCGIYNPADDGDYPDKMCSKCWDIGKPFRLKMGEARNRFYEEEDRIDKEWREACK